MTAVVSSYSTLSTVLKPLVRDEAPAVRAAEERIARISHVGPHYGPGSGAGLNFCISRLRSRLERLDTWRDNPDTDDDEEDEDEERVPRLPTRLMSY